MLDNELLESAAVLANGYVQAHSLPEDAVPLLVAGDGGVVTFCYPFGTGAVIYSTIPLDAYLEDWRPGRSAATKAFARAYSSNLLAYAAAGACRSQTAPVSIDIEPRSSSNAVRKRAIQVLILSGPGFDAASQVDISSLRFGTTGKEPSLYRCRRFGRDVNRDGLPDLYCSFLTDRVGGKAGESYLILTGLSTDGRPLWAAQPATIEIGH